MGNHASRIFPRGDDHEEKSKNETVCIGKIESNEMCTPVGSRKPTADPRSATSEIVRTPIEIASTPDLPRYVVSAIPKHLQVKRYLETDLDNIMPSPSAEQPAFIQDPRSPNFNHQRTPIMAKPVSNYLSPIVVVNNGPDEITPEGKGIDPRSPATNFDRTPIWKQKTDLETDEFKPRISYCETTLSLYIPEIQAVPRVITQKPLKLEDRLNTSDELNSSGLEYSSCDSDISNESLSEEQVTVIPNFRAMNFNEKPEPNSTFDEELFENALEDDSIIEEQKNDVEENRGKIRVWRDSISPKPFEATKKEMEKNPEIIIEFDDETIIKSSKPEVSKISVRKSGNFQSQIPVGKRMNGYPVKKDFKTAYEDVKASNETSKVRTPLANRSNNSKISILGKSPQQLFRNKGLSTKQQENTPPISKRIRDKTRANNGTTWDPDMSVII